jgi:hypothetical protein
MIRVEVSGDKPRIQQTQRHGFEISKVRMEQINRRAPMTAKQSRMRLYRRPRAFSFARQSRGRLSKQEDKERDGSSAAQQTRSKRGQGRMRSRASASRQLKNVRRDAPRCKHAHAQARKKKHEQARTEQTKADHQNASKRKSKTQSQNHARNSPRLAICATSGTTISVPVNSTLSPGLACSTTCPRRGRQIG